MLLYSSGVLDLSDNYNLPPTFCKVTWAVLNVLAGGSLYLLPSAVPEEASVMTTGLGSGLWVSRNIIRNHFIDVFPFISSVWFYPRASQVPGQSGSVSTGSLSRVAPHVRPIIGWSPPQALNHHCPQNILQEGQLVGERFCDWVGVPVPPLGAYASYRRWTVHVPRPPLLGRPR